jgi:sec-independent protein translocase protein TatC
MASPEEPKGAQAPESGNLSGEAPVYDPMYAAGIASPANTVFPPETVPPPASPPAAAGGGGPKAPPPPPPPPDDDHDEDGMLRMSFLEHLEELRRRIFLMLIGVGVAFVASLTFSKELWNFVKAPAVEALTTLGIKGMNGGPPQLTQVTPMEAFNIIWVKMPILAAIFLAAPWILYQVWAFISPGLYKKERRWATPFVVCSAGLFLLGGAFGYFVAFRYGLTFLLGLGRDNGVTPLVSLSEYFDLFVNVMLGISLVFELPILIFFLTLLHIVSPRFLIAHSRYAILGIVILAAIITPTPDVFNLVLFATPMCALFYVGIFASYLLVLHREHKKFPWAKVIKWTVIVLAVLAVAVYVAMVRYHLRIVPHWPFLTR